MSDSAPAHTFTDGHGREWRLAFTVWHNDKVKRDVGVDLTKMVRTDMCAALAADPCQMVAVVFALVEDEAKKRGIPPEEFGKSLFGDSLDRAYDALLRTLIDFHGGGKREALRRAYDIMQESQQAMLDATNEAFDKAGDPKKIVAKMKEQLTAKLLQAFDTAANAGAAAAGIIAGDTNHVAAAVGSTGAESEKAANEIAAAVGAAGAEMDAKANAAARDAMSNREAA